MVEWKEVRLPGNIKYLLEVKCSKVLNLCWIWCFSSSEPWCFSGVWIFLIFWSFVFKDPTHLSDLFTVVCLPPVLAEEGQVIEGAYFLQLSPVDLSFLPGYSLSFLGKFHCCSLLSTTAGWGWIELPSCSSFTFPFDELMNSSRPPHASGVCWVGLVLPKSLLTL